MSFAGRDKMRPMMTNPVTLVHMIDTYGNRKFMQARFHDGEVTAVNFGVINHRTNEAIHMRIARLAGDIGIVELPDSFRPMDTIAFAVESVERSNEVTDMGYVVPTSLMPPMPREKKLLDLAIEELPSEEKCDKKKNRWEKINDSIKE